MADLLLGTVGDVEDAGKAVIASVEPTLSDVRGTSQREYRTWYHNRRWWARTTLFFFAAAFVAVAIVWLVLSIIGTQKQQFSISIHYARVSRTGTDRYIDDSTHIGRVYLGYYLMSLCAIVAWALISLMAWEYFHPHSLMHNVATRMVQPIGVLYGAVLGLETLVVYWQLGGNDFLTSILLLLAGLFSIPLFYAQRLYSLKLPPAMTYHVRGPYGRDEMRVETVRNSAGRPSGNIITGVHAVDDATWFTGGILALLTMGLIVWLEFGYMAKNSHQQSWFLASPILWSCQIGLIAIMEWLAVGYRFLGDIRPSEDWSWVRDRTRFELGYMAIFLIILMGINLDLFIVGAEHRFHT